MALGIALWDGGESELEFRGWGGAGIQGPLEALGKRGQNTQKASSASFLITFSPHTDYCLSCELFQRESPFSSLLSFWEQGRFRKAEAKGCITSP
ncbi:LOW QUALITY PROTEIN: putative cancer susceptibility gene HEPN1 protein [Pteropus vampyrus]|uniref:LOW QUALITY PROTEIN: putative cancer susceptibility gene HEPN1 protein n=1 Tax=Pteropus vampyrus TaxID=132908 RepID=A0A6P3QZH9_PTEVA|nr:LOW QUALITY PROTEIN: putative cancer susceptibility gene HEPN1 protein [Pteropus vampyrus]